MQLNSYFKLYQRPLKTLKKDWLQWKKENFLKMKKLRMKKKSKKKSLFWRLKSSFKFFLKIWTKIKNSLSLVKKKLWMRQQVLQFKHSLQNIVRIWAIKKHDSKAVKQLWVSNGHLEVKIYQLQLSNWSMTSSCTQALCGQDSSFLA